MSKANEKLPHSFIQAFAMLYLSIISEGIMMLEAINIYVILPLRDFVPTFEYIQCYIVLICNAITFCISMIMFFYAYTVKPPDARKRRKIKRWMNVNFMLAILSFLNRTSIVDVGSNGEELVLSNLTTLSSALNVAFSSLHMYLNRNINSVNAGYDAIKKNDNYGEEDQQMKNSPVFTDSLALSPTSYANTAKDT